MTRRVKCSGAMHKNQVLFQIAGNSKGDSCSVGASVRIRNSVSAVGKETVDD